MSASFAMTMNSSAFPRVFAVLTASTSLFGVGVVAAVSGVEKAGIAVALAFAAVPLGYGLWRAFSFVFRKLDALDFFSPWVAFPLAYILWFVLGTTDFIDDPFHVLYGMFDPMPAAIWGYAALGLVGYLFGVFVAGTGQNRLRAMPRPAEIANRWRPSLERAALWVFFLLMLGSYIALVARMGIPVLSAGAAEDRLKIFDLGPTHSLLLVSAWTLIVLLPASHWAGIVSGRWTLFGLALASALLLSLGGRTNFLVGLVVVCIAGNYLRRAVRLRTLILLVLVSFALMSTYGFVRDLAFQGADSDGSLNAIGIPAPIQPLIYASTYVRGSVATFRDVTYVIPSEVPYQYGQLTLLPLATLLPGHHPLADVFFKDVLGHDFVGGGQPATPLGPLYCDFGPLGIFGGLFLFGVLVGKAYESLRRKPQIGTVLVYAWITQVGLFGLFSGLFPNITSLFVPVMWSALDRFLSLAPPRKAGDPVPA